MEKLRFGIIGCGTIAKRFAKALAKSESGVLVACAARDLARAEAFAAEQEEEQAENGAQAKIKAYGSYEELLADPAVQAIYIATVNVTHAEIAKMAIHAGKAVVSEKPFFTNAAEAKEVITLAKEKQVLVMEGFWTRTMPAYLKAKEWIREGKIGELKMIRAAFCFNLPYNDYTRNIRHWDPAVGGGALLDAGVYPYEYVTGIMGGPPEELQTMVARGETGVDATVAMMMRYPGGVIADCLTSFNGYMDSTAVLSGPGGYITQDYFLGCRKTELHGPRGELLECYEDPEEEGFVHEIDHFAALYAEGKTESDLIPLADTLDFAKKVEVILASDQKRAAAEEGLPAVSKFTAAELAEHERKYRFAHFTAGDAMKLGTRLVELAAEDGKSAAIQIELNGLEVFRYMPEGTGRFNDYWMQKKKNTVKMMGTSTLRLWTNMNDRGIRRQMEMAPSGEIVFCGGGFPILLTDGSVIGVIAVSGPGDEYEHELIIRALEEMYNDVNE